MNEKMAERIGRDPDALVGEAIWEEFPSIVGTELEERTAWRLVNQYRKVTSRSRHVTGFNYWVEVRAFPDDDGLTVFSREITTERERELKLSVATRMLRHNLRNRVTTLLGQAEMRRASLDTR
ncbi:hypothetical protein C9J85_06830 [Haloferax sp. wsp5]|nr:hypothetical protein C9J85_06830 [Haloferax sp. wsp5]